jgi:hypothetical protein
MAAQASSLGQAVARGIPTLVQVIRDDITPTSSIASTTIVWRVWNQEYTSSLVMTATDTGTGGSANSSAIVWGSWNVCWVQVSDSASVSSLPTPARLSQVELELRREFEAEQKVVRAAAAKAREEARRRAQALLDENLSAEQRDSLAKARYFTVHSRDGKRQYRIQQGRAGNVFLVEGKNYVRKFCIHPKLDCPDEDTMLSQKLLLEGDEQEFLRIANPTQMNVPIEVMQRVG